jgi:ribonuclease VapC
MCMIPLMMRRSSSRGLPRAWRTLSVPDLADRGYIRSDRYSARRPEAEACARAIESSAARCISAANFLEAALVIDASHDPIASRRFDDFMKEAQIVVEPVTVKPRLELRERPIATSGRAAATPRETQFRRCFAYALAKVKGEPLLFKGSDFAQTDIKSRVSKLDVFAAGGIGSV